MCSSDLILHEFGAVPIRRPESETDLLGAFPKLHKTAGRLAVGESFSESHANRLDGGFQLGPVVVVKKTNLDREEGPALIGGQAPDRIVDELSVGDGENLPGQSLESDTAQAPFPDEAVVFLESDAVSRPKDAVR